MTEEAVAAKMRYDKVAFMQKAAPDCIVSSDMSCLMHLQECACREKQEIPSPISPKSYTEYLYEFSRSGQEP